MDWREVGRTVARTAPALGAAMGGPAGAAIGGLVATAFGAEASPQAVANVIASDPIAAVRLREIELRHAEVLASLASQEYVATLEDVQHARATHSGHWMPATITLTLAAMTAGAFGVLALVEIPESNREPMLMLTGQLLGAFAASVAYWIGTSRSSADKQRMLESRGLNGR